VNDAERLARDRDMRAIVGREGLDRAAASSSQMGRFETKWLATDANPAALTDLSGTWIERVHECKPPEGIILDMDSSESPTHGEQEGSAWNGHFGCTCYHPLFLFNQFGDLERCLLRPGNAHSTEDCHLVLVPVIVRYRERGVDLCFRADAAFAKPEIYELLEHEGIRYAIRLPANQVSQRRIGHLLTRPVGRPPKKPVVTFTSFRYQAKGWTRARRVVAKVEWHQGELCPRVGFIVTNLNRPPEWVVKFYNGRGTAEQRAPLDAAVVPCLSAQRGAAPAARARLQSRQLRAHLGLAPGGRALVADDLAREAREDRRQGRAPWTLRRLPASRGGGAPSPVRRDPAAD
jgi:Transposase DDE domain group 1